MKYFRLFKNTFSITAISLFLSSCTQTIDEDVELDLDTKIVANDTEVELILIDFENIADQAEINDFVTKKTYELNDLLTDCGSVTKDTIPGDNFDSLKITVDFGVENCLGLDGRKRNGKIEILSIYNNASGLRRVRKINSANFSVNNNSIYVSKSFVYDNQNDQNQHKWAETSRIGIKYTNGDTLHKEIQRTHTLIKGAETIADFSDNEWTISTSGNGLRTDGLTYHSESAENKLMIYKSTCEFIVSGVVHYTVDGGHNISIDYGNGDCDNRATAKSQGETWDVFLN
ncbi:MAG: hypothetical protein ACI9U0_000231 [Flavobacteriales bacterium]|jgi:hypothetical protein|tara:strand:- start:1956 stop:2816 length:861 start_codon:yes stop_codon:yes gene_type:complete